MIFHTLGHQDELNAVIGIASEYCAAYKNGLQPMLSEIQSRLFDLGAAVATPVQNSSEEKVQYTKFAPEHTLKLEEWIDHLDAQLPPLTNFVIPVRIDYSSIGVLYCCSLLLIVTTFILHTCVELYDCVNCVYELY